MVPRGFFLIAQSLRGDGSRRSRLPASMFMSEWAILDHTRPLPEFQSPTLVHPIRLIDAVMQRLLFALLLLVCTFACGGKAEDGPIKGHVVYVIEWPTALTLNSVVIASGVTFVGGFYESAAPVPLPGGLVLPASRGRDGVVLRLSPAGADALSVVGGDGTDTVYGISPDSGAGIVALVLSNGSAIVDVGSQSVAGSFAKAIVARLDIGCRVTSAVSFASDDAAFQRGRIAGSPTGDVIVAFQTKGGPSAATIGTLALAKRELTAFLRVTKDGTVRWAKAVEMAWHPEDELVWCPLSVALGPDGAGFVFLVSDSPMTVNDFELVETAPSTESPARVLTARVDADGHIPWARLWSTTHAQQLTLGGITLADDGATLAVVGRSGGALRMEGATIERLTGFASLLDTRTGASRWSRTDPVVIYGTPRIDATGRLWASVLFGVIPGTIDGVTVDPQGGEAPALARFGEGGRLGALSSATPTLSSSGAYVALDREASFAAAVGRWSGGMDWGDGVARDTGPARSITLTWDAD